MSDLDRITLVILNEDGLPKLRLSRRYRTMAEQGTEEAEQEARTYLKERVRSAKSR